MENGLFEESLSMYEQTTERFATTLARNAAASIDTAEDHLTFGIRMKYEVVYIIENIRAQDYTFNLNAARTHLAHNADDFGYIFAMECATLSASLSYHAKIRSAQESFQRQIFQMREGVGAFQLDGFVLGLAYPWSTPLLQTALAAGQTRSFRKTIEVAAVSTAGYALVTICEMQSVIVSKANGFAIFIKNAFYQSTAAVDIEYVKGNDLIGKIRSELYERFHTSPRLYWSGSALIPFQPSIRRYQSIFEVQRRFPALDFPWRNDRLARSEWVNIRLGYLGGIDMLSTPFGDEDLSVICYNALEAFDIRR